MIRNYERYSLMLFLVLASSTVPCGATVISLRPPVFSGNVNNVTVTGAGTFTSVDFAGTDSTIHEQFICERRRSRLFS